MVWRRGDTRRRRNLALVAVAGGLALASVASPVRAQILPPRRTTTTTTTPPATTAPPSTDPPTTAAPSTEPPPTSAPATTAPDGGSSPTTTAAPGSDGPAASSSSGDTGGAATGDSSSSSPPGAGGAAPGDDGGDGSGLSPLGGDPSQVIPPDAQAFLSHLHRSAPNDDRALVAGEKALVAAGYDPDQAARIAYGHFPVAGPARWEDDWLAPRFSGTTFRYHYGVDLDAAYGTPLRSPDDGTVRIVHDDLGGLTVEVVLPDGTFYELAHLSDLAAGLASGQKVHTGDLLGYVGSSGDAVGAHLHFGLWVGGSKPTSPKPLLDQWVADGAAHLQTVLAPVRARTRPSLGTAITRALAEDEEAASSSGPAPSSADLLLASAGSPVGGAVQVAQAAVSRLAGDVDWQARAAQDDGRREASRALAKHLADILGSIVPGAADALSYASR